MENIKQSELSQLHQNLPAPIPATALQQDDIVGQSQLKRFPQPPKNFIERTKATKKRMKRLVAAYCSSVRKKMKQEIKRRNEAKGLSVYSRGQTLDERIKSFVLLRLSDDLLDKKEASKKPLRNLIPHIKKFDWRRYNVVPKLRLQEDPSSCWAYTATEAYESSLMIQRANFTIQTQDVNTIKPDQIMLNVNSTLDSPKILNGRDESGGRNEVAFDFYLKTGIPEDEVTFNDFDNRDSQLDPGRSQQGKTIKAVAWDYVNAKPWRTPTIHTPSLIRRIKVALLEHGPLAVMVSFDEGFKNYGRPITDKAADNVTDATAGKNLRFQADTVTFRKDEKEKQFLSLQWDMAITKRDSETDDLIVHFPADKSPILEPRTKNTIKRRPTDCDDAVTLNMNSGMIELGFTKNNAVVIEQDADTGEVVLHFPANTDAQFTTDPDTQDLIARFPADKSPTYSLHQEIAPNHYVLLIGWDDIRCAWIIQNTFSDWGYQCNGPNLGIEPSEDRGYMYIAYGCNQIGQFAAWIEARLIGNDFWKRRERSKQATS